MAMKKAMKPAMKKKSMVPPNDLGPDRTVQRAVNQDMRKVKKANAKAYANDMKMQKSAMNVKKVAKGKK